MNEPGAGHTPRTIMLVVGEPSGDQLGAQLMAGLKEIAGNRVRIVGVGGSAMNAQGLQSLFPLDATSVMGLREVVPRIPAILKHVREAADFALRTHPDLVVIIDSPDFTHRIAQRLKRIDPSIRTANYVAPQVWASRSYRARKMARYIDAVLTLFPFEAAFFERYGIRAFSVGYPVVERANRMTGGAAFRQRRGIPPDAPLLAVLPGSRRSEIRFILPPFKAAVAILAAADRRLAFKHARIRLAEPRVAAVAGTADEVTAAAGQYLRELEELAVRLAEVTGQTRSRIEDDLSAGRILTADQARDYGLIDEIIGKA